MGASDYLKGIGGGALGGAAAGSALGPWGAAGGAILGGLFGGLSTHDTQQAGDQQKAAMAQAIAAAQASGKRQQGFNMGVERLGQQYVAPMDDMFRHLYGGGVGGVANVNEQRAMDKERMGLMNGDGNTATAMRGTPPPPGTMAAPLGPPTPGMPGWHGTAATPQGQPAAPPRPQAKPPGKPVGFR